MPGGSLPRADTELMILRTAHNCHSDYEWRAHQKLALNAGLTSRPDTAGPRGGAGNGFLSASASASAGDGRASCQPDRLRRHVGQLRARLSDPELIELCMLIGHYEMLAMTLNSLGVPPDPPALGRLPHAARLLQRLAGHGRSANRRRDPHDHRRREPLRAFLARLTAARPGRLAAVAGDPPAR